MCSSDLENGVSITDSAKMYEVQDYMTLWNYTCIHRDAVSGRYPSGASHGSGADGDCASGGKQKRTGDTAQSIRKGTLDGIPGCILGPADAGHYSGRDLRRNLYAYGSGGSVRHLGLFVGIFIYRQIRFRELYTLLLDSVSTTATVMFITAAASLFAYVLTRARLDVAISTALQQVTGGSTMIFFIIVNIILLIAGCFLDSTSALYIFTPLFVPVANALGIDLVHLGVVMIVNLAIGLFTPPVGVNLYVACGVADVNLKDISKAVIPLLIASILVLLIVKIGRAHV